MKTEIKILHAPCCGNGNPQIRKRLESLAEKKEIDIQIIDITDMAEVMSYGTMTFPSLAINGKIYDYNKLKKAEDLINAIKA
ncbi:thioredoxin family protein [Aureibacter tunicatorum]|uniref:Thioredoxin-like fold domain-containing protein n=1 Tax=Aureibacter tunicatorum TaxID=866807 RepID=A0AAE4BSV5_9BACT|nr:thioredoxin family protein [Aureibacter tunicatorum]MDR6238827.1 hypothetical protein [Aureibacter tunicatorum]BDD05246.1 hypothetical protein AUTU_27290 [Aureibacter tunicatorum]